MKSIYTRYKERLVEISGKSRSIYSKKGDTRYSCDLSKFLGDVTHLDEFVDRLWNGKSHKPFEIIGKDTALSLYYSQGIDQAVKQDPRYKKIVDSGVEVKKQLADLKNKELKKEVSENVNAFYKLRKEIVDIAKETGRYELYVGYPFVEGCIGSDTIIKAPLILFPVKINVIDDGHANIEIVKDMPVTLNKAFLMAYAKEKRLNIDDMVMEFGDDLGKRFKDVESVIKYLKDHHIDIDYKVGSLDDVSPLEASGIPNKGSDLTVTNHCVIGRYPLANSIYMDYGELENRKASTNGAIEELIYANSLDNKPKRAVKSLYTISKLDSTQEKAIERINNEGNMVIYGPPGTGKSQTIVNIISDALARKKRVLMISQKKAALDVVYNRLGKLKERAMFIADSEKEKDSFYKKCYDAHFSIENYDCSEDIEKHAKLQKSIDEQYAELEKIFKVLYEPTSFGVCLETMYEQSSNISKNSYDYEIFEDLSSREDLLKVKYNELLNSIESINQNNRRDLYYKYQNMKSKNAIMDHVKGNLDVYSVDSALDKLEKITSSRNLGFDISKYPYCSYLIADYVNNIDKENIDLDKLVTFIARSNKKKGFIVPSKFERELKDSFIKVLEEIKKEVSNYDIFKDVLDEKGYQMIVAAILNGNVNMLRNLKTSLNNYTQIKDIKVELAKLSSLDNKILDFAYNFSDTSAKYNQVLNNFMPIRMYIEIVKEEQLKKEDLAKIMNFPSIKENILLMKKKQEELSKNIAGNAFNNDYINLYQTSKNNKDFLYQISKQHGAWPIRKFMQEYKDLMLDLYPCWLLSPENASTVLPLVKDMFDIVLVDEASQVFIENTLPLMYRGKNIVVAGDSKQLRPSSTFMKRYSGADIDENLDPTTEATLEVESLLDLATSRLPSTNLNYHYRSRSEELIDFSNSYFYDDKLEVVPNLTGGKKNKAITRIKVDGRWINRRNEEEARSTVLLLKKLLLTRKENESIGIISFNSDQANAIEEEIRKECKRDSKFAELILKEQNRFENGEDTSLFIKNLENVQGDERDIIILSTGYAKNENDKVYANFGSLSLEGGENRLNVAITRAKKKTFVVTSIEPEELNVETTKNEGPKILKKYLNYVRAVSNNKKSEIIICLNNKRENIEEEAANNMVDEIKRALEKLGYCVELNVGNTKRKIDLAVYDKVEDRYLLGVECINKNYKNIEEMIESRIYHDGFLESRGWNIYHVWARDWCNNKTKVINSIVKEIERARINPERNDKLSNSSQVKKRR